MHVDVTGDDNARREAKEDRRREYSVECGNTRRSYCRTTFRCFKCSMLKKFLDYWTFSHLSIHKTHKICLGCQICATSMAIGCFRKEINAINLVNHEILQLLRSSKTISSQENSLPMDKIAPARKISANGHIATKVCTWCLSAQSPITSDVLVSSSRIVASKIARACRLRMPNSAQVWTVKQE